MRRIQDRVKEIAECVKGLSTEPVFAPCQVASVVKEVFEALDWFADQKGLTLASEGLTALPQIMADERRLFNAFYNLINNSIPEVPAGGSISVFGKEDPPGAGILVSIVHAASRRAVTFARTNACAPSSMSKPERTRRATSLRGRSPR